jgi:hypothetical protein
MLGDQESDDQTLPRQRRKFNLGHIQPRPLLGRIVQLELLRLGKRLSRRQDLIKGARRVGIEIILH